MPRLVASTCGTSLLTSRALVSPAPQVKELVGRYTNMLEAELPAAKRAVFDEHLQNVRDRLVAAPPHEAEVLSAELHGIIRYYGQEWPAAARRDRHVLLHTDTYLGSRTAALVQEWLEGQGVHAALKCMRGLNTSSTRAFESGMVEVVAWCQQTQDDFRPAGWRVVYNLSGGFKSWQGYISALGMLYADELVYIFETGSEVIHIPRLPLTLDLAEVRVHFDLLRRMSIEPVAPEALQGVREALYSERDGRMGLSVLGEVLFGQARNELYRERLLPSPHAHLRFGPQAEPSSRRWAGTRQMAQINARMDDLARYLLHGWPTKGLDFKALQGNPTLPSTHEVDLWSDGLPWRGFGHFEGPVFVIDRFGEHLR